MKEGKKLEYPEKTPDDEFQPHTKAPKIRDPGESQTHTLALVAGQESTCANHYTTRRPSHTRDFKNWHSSGCPARRLAL